jgi:type IX secretion system PorP/SprF family membrane protein
MKFNKNIIALAVIALVSTVQAQQIPLYSNYFFTPYIYNPSRSGTEGFTEATLLHRRQWTDIQGSPETSALALNGSLNEEKVGWSIYGFSDQTDIIKRIGVYGNYAYHVKLSDKSQLSFGLGAGYLANNIDVNSIRARDPNDVFIITNGDRGSFDLNFGINLKLADFQIGAAVPQLIGNSVKYAEVPNTDTKVAYSLLRHYVFNAQYDFGFAGDKNVLSPMVMVRAAKNVPVQVDAGLMFAMKDYGYIGAMFRSEYAVTGNLGVNLTEQLTVGYAYDFSLNDYGSDLGTSHEFMLTYRFGNNKRNERLENEIKKLKDKQRKQKDETEEIIEEKLEEFKDEMKRQMEQDMKEAADAAAAQAAQDAQNNNQAGNNSQQGNNQQGNQQGNNNATRGNQGQQNNGQGQYNNNQGGNTNDNYNNESNTNNNNYQNNTASNVSPGSSGYYVVAGVFSNKANADRLQRKLQNQGVDARTFQDPGNSYYYVYLLKFDNHQQADQAKASNLNGTYTGDLWIKIIK